MNIYRRLQEQLDRYSVGFPATDSGIELEILQEMFTESEAALFTALTARLEPPEAVAARLGRPVEEIADRLESMAQKGLLFRKREEDSVHYCAIPFIHGLIEFQINRSDKKMVKLLGRYLKEKFNDDMAGNAKLFIRTIPVGQSVTVKHHVAPYEDAREILKNEKLIVVTDCACRKQSSMFGKDCGKPIEVCFMFGPMGEYYIENGLGREIDIEEALDILAKAQEAGLITQPAGAQKPFTMCSCCGDCCGFMRAVNLHPKPVELVFSNYFARVDEEACSGCETCLGRCQMGAIDMTGEGRSKINTDRCIGCGLCVTTCPEKAIELIAKPRREQVEPPLNTPEQMVRLARNRGIEDDDASCVVSFGF